MKRQIAHLRGEIEVTAILNAIRSTGEETGDSPQTRRRSFSAIHGSGLRRFPTVEEYPQLPSALPDETLDFYAFIFCHGRFLELGMTFEQFLLVIATVAPGRLCPSCEP